MLSKKRQLTIYKFITRWVPPALLSSVLAIASTLRYCFYPRKKKLEIEKTKLITGTIKSNKAYIMATGPSINQIEMEILSDGDVFSVSNFFLHDSIQELNIKGHFFADYHEPLILSEYVDWLRSADKILPIDTPIFLGYPMKKIVEGSNLFKDREVYYFAFEKHFSLYGLALGVPFVGPHSSPIFLLSLAIALGYSEIYLCGCDHTVLRDYKSDVTNFYTQNQDQRSNATGQLRWESGIKAHTVNFLNIIEQYEMLQKIALKKGVKIFNMSDDSWIEGFPNHGDR